MKRWQFPCTVPQLRFSSEIRNCPNILKSTRRFPPQGTVMKHCTHRRKQHYAKREVPAIRRCASGLNLFRHGVFANPDLPPTLQLGIAAALRGQSGYSATTTPVGAKGFEILQKTVSAIRVLRSRPQSVPARSICKNCQTNLPPIPMDHTLRLFCNYNPSGPQGFRDTSKKSIGVPRQTPRCSHTADAG